MLYHPCFVNVAVGKEIQAWRDSSNTAMVGTGKFGSAKAPMATATYPGTAPVRRWHSRQWHMEIVRWAATSSNGSRSQELQECLGRFRADGT